MRAGFCILVWLLASVNLAADDTNVVDLLRQFMQELDRQEQGAPPGSPSYPATTEGALPTPTAQPQPQAAEPTGPSPLDVYRLRSGDRVKVEVSNEPAMSTEDAVVDEKGNLPLPIAGPIAVGGKTVEEATRVVRDFLGTDYLVKPQVKLTLLSKAKMTVDPPVGLPRRETTEEIWPGVPNPEKPAANDLTPTDPAPPATRTQTASTADQCVFSISNQVRKPGRYRWACAEKMTLLRAIGMAGGATGRADLTRVVIRRRVGGKRQEFLHDLPALIQNPEALPPEIQSGDEVVVPRK